MNTHEKTRFLLLDRLEQVNKKKIFINEEMKSEYINSFFKKLFKLELKFLDNYKILFQTYLFKNEYNKKKHEKTTESALNLLEHSRNGIDELYLYIAGEVQLYYHISDYIRDDVETRKQQEQNINPLRVAVC